MPGSWSVGGDLNVARYGLAGCGTYTSSLSFGGGIDADIGTTYMNDTESYDGTTWTIEGDIVTSRRSLCGSGTNTAALCSGGYLGEVVGNTEEYNGTVWSSITGGDLNTARSLSAMAGIQTASVIFGGNTADGGGETTLQSSEEYNGTTWSAGADLDAKVDSHSGCGILTAALSFGGVGSSYEGVTTEEYNGTIWTAGGDLNSGAWYGSGCGVQTAALSFGGNAGEILQTDTEEYTGTAWTIGGDLNTAVFNGTGAGLLTSGLSIGGGVGSLQAETATTEEYSTNYGQHIGISGIDGGILFKGKTIIGDRANGKLYALDMDTYTENGELIKRVRRTQIINKQRVNVIHNRIEIEFEPGVGLDVSEDNNGYDPKAKLSWSDDGGNTFNTGRYTSIGEYEKYGTRAIWRGLGKSRNRVYELTITEPVKVILIGTYGNLKPCKF